MPNARPGASLHVKDATLQIPEVLCGQVLRGHVAILHEVQTGHLFARRAARDA